MDVDVHIREHYSSQRCVLLAVCRAVENEVGPVPMSLNIAFPLSRWMAMDAISDSRWFPVRML